MIGEKKCIRSNYVGMKKVFEIERLADLREYLSAKADVEALRMQLFAGFQKYSQYRNAREWNAAVRICEALAVIGWGQHEPVEAIRGIYVNGNPETYFINRYSKPRCLDAVWSKRKDGLAIDYEISSFYGTPEAPLESPVRMKKRLGEVQDVKLCSQRNWIPKNPVRIIRGIANCYESSQKLVDSIENDLIPELNRKMRPELYGAALDSIIICLSFSFYDHYYCKTNYIIADESLKLKSKDLYPKLLEMYSEKEIVDNGYFLRKRFTYGPFRSDTGTARVTIVLEKEFSQMSIPGQKQKLSEYLVQALENMERRLERKIIYDFPLMISDFRSILYSWRDKAMFP